MKIGNCISFLSQYTLEKKDPIFWNTVLFKLGMSTAWKLTGLKNVKHGHKGVTTKNSSHHRKAPCQEHCAGISQD